MMKLLRSQSQLVLVVILIVLGGSFVFYGIGNVMTGSGGREGGNDFGRIDGQDLSVAELYDAIRTTRNLLILTNRTSLLNQPDGHAQLAREAWLQLLFVREAARLHIEISDRELTEHVRNQPEFQKNGAYSPELYQTEMTELQTITGMTPDAYERAVRQSLLVDAVTKALFSSIHAAPSELAPEFEKYYGTVQLSTITFDPKTYAAALNITPAEIEAEYKAHPDSPAYRTAEKREVDYVYLPLSPDQAKLKDKEKTAAIEALGEKALTFALALEPEPSADTNSTPPPAPDFQAEAKKRGLNPMTTDFFAADAVPAGLPPSPAVNNAAFALTQANPISKVIELDNGVVVLHLAGIQPSELKPLAEVSAAIAQQLKQTRATGAAQAAASLAARQLNAAMAKSPDFKAAAAALKLNVVSLPAFVPVKAAQTDPNMRTVAEISTTLNPGGLSEPVPTDSGQGIALIHLDSRAPAGKADQAQFEAHFREVQDEQQRSLAERDWSDWQNHQPGTHPPPNLDDYGGVD